MLDAGRDTRWGHMVAWVHWKRILSRRELSLEKLEERNAVGCVKERKRKAAAESERNSRLHHHPLMPFATPSPARL